MMPLSSLFDKSDEERLSKNVGRAVADGRAKARQMPGQPHRSTPTHPLPGSLHPVALRMRSQNPTAARCCLLPERVGTAPSWKRLA